METNSLITARLAESDLYSAYKKSFDQATGISLNLSPAGSSPDDKNMREADNAFCMAMRQSDKTCEMCRRVHQLLIQTLHEETKSVNCLAGLIESAVPVSVNGTIISYLGIGQVFVEAPGEDDFERIRHRILQFGKRFDDDELYKRFHEIPVIDYKQYEATLRLLEFFARQLGDLATQLSLEKDDIPNRIIKAKAYLEDHVTEEVSLDEVAKAVNLSSFYFSRLFKKETERSFVEYLSDLRVRKAQQLLGNTRMSISQVGFEVGFKSLTHFNRVFKKVTDTTPSAYRKQSGSLV